MEGEGTGERFDAETALADRAGRRGRRGSRRRRRAGRRRYILSGGPIAVREAKRLALESGDEEDLLARAAERRTSEEGQEGLRAFLEKRRASWH